MLRKHVRNPETMTKIGYVALILASLFHWFLNPKPHFGSSLADAAQGFLYGIAIGALSVGIWRQSRRSGCGGSQA